jgi:hypothetical protein
MRRFLTPVLMGALALPLQAQAQVQGQVKARTAPAPQAQVPPEALPGFDRARDNLLALRDGRRAVSDLTRQELQDVLDLDRQVRGSAADTRSFRERCIESEVRREGGNPSRLAWEVIRLKCRD